MRINLYLIGLWLIVLGIPCSRALVEIGATTLIVAWLWQKWRARDFRLPRSSLLTPYGAFVIWAGLSLLWSQYPALTLKAFLWQTLEYAAIYLAVSDSLRQPQARRLIWLWLWWSLAMFADGLIQLARGTDLAGHPVGLIAGGARMTSALIYPNDFGAYTSMTAMIACGVALAERSRSRRNSALAAAIALVNVAGIILTFSRGAWLGFALAVLTALMLYRTRYAVPLLVATGVAAAFLPAPYVERFASIVDWHVGSASEERLLLWRSALRMIHQHPLIGFGLNTYNATFPKFKDPAIWGTPYAHNCFLQLTVELGAVGLALFGWLLVRIFKQSWRIAQMDGWERSVALSLIAGAAGYVMHSATDTNFYALPLAVMWWLALGLIDRLHGLREDRQRLIIEHFRRIVAIRTDRLGDVLLNLPALAALRQRFPHATLTVVVQPPLDELLRGQPGVDAVMPYTARDATPGQGTLRWAWKLRQGHFDAAVILNPTKQAHLAAALAGIPIRAGYARKLDWLLTEILPDRKAAGDRHEVDYNLELVGLLGARAPDRIPRLTVTSQERQVAAQLLQDAGIIPGQKPLIALHPWTSDSAKQWPLACVAELIERLALEKTVGFILIGGPEETDHAQHFLAGLRTPVASVVGHLSLRQLAALLTHCRVLVSNDSGPVHVAAAVGTATITLFTGQRPAATPRRWGPVGPGHTILTPHHPEMPIPVDEVYLAVQRQVATSRPTA